MCLSHLIFFYQYESEENFEESVNCYRNAIGTLLQSVQVSLCFHFQLFCTQIAAKAMKVVMP
jgi:hypothetical protein